MNLNKIKLKIKTISLADESRTIKRLEKGCENERGFNPIYSHRVKEVRNEARATHLARAFISGMPYKSIEPSRKYCKERTFAKIRERLYKIAAKYNRASKADINEWLLTT